MLRLHAVLVSVLMGLSTPAQAQLISSDNAQLNPSDSQGFPFVINDGTAGGPGSAKLYEGKRQATPDILRTVTALVCNFSDSDMLMLNPSDSNEPAITVKPKQCGSIQSYEIRVDPVSSGGTLLQGRFWIYP